MVRAAVLATIVGLVGEGVYWTAEHQYRPQALIVRWAYNLGKEVPLPTLEKLPEESFMMGGEIVDDEQPVHPVMFTGQRFLGTTEVTFAQYDAFVDATGVRRPDDREWGRDNRPVINVDWLDARAYARWLGAMTGNSCRLPSEAEWEYACRAGTTTRY